MNKQAHFEKSLKRGLSFERDAATALLHFAFPECAIKRYAKDPTEKDGPRAFVGRERNTELVLPDFEIYDPVTSKRFYIDSKLKVSFYSSNSTKRPGEKYLTIDARAQKEYNSTMNFYKDMKMYLLFGVEENRTAYIVEWNPNPETVFFNNQYGKGEVPIYYKSDLKEIGTF